eukprot:TRINITY_DN26865_c0_g1_i1.p1 TRINITY_DN26865_c0_g1~~TRINITY_DN26865_c0_g1_i1.p1  ORF type:complete len:331 (-),score=69.11 TRINITY_DN26865_c0_g1_i1:5-940(-)
MRILAMLDGEDEKEEKLRWVLNALERGVDFDPGFDEQTRNDIVLNCYFLAHMMHICGVLSNLKRQKLFSFSNDPLQYLSNNLNDNNKITNEYLYILYVRLCGLKQVNENSNWKQRFHSPHNNSHTLNTDTNPTFSESNPYWETKLFIYAMSYLVCRNCEGEKEREEGRKNLDCFLEEFEKMWFNLLVIVGPMIMDALVEEKDWRRSKRMMRRIKEMCGKDKMPCLRALVEMYGEMVEGREEEGEEGGKEGEEERKKGEKGREKKGGERKEKEKKRGERKKCALWCCGGGGGGGGACVVRGGCQVRCVSHKR